MEKAAKKYCPSGSAGNRPLSGGGGRAANPEGGCGPSDATRNWYVLKTKQRAEPVCMKELEQKGIEYVCPLTREFRFRRRRHEVVPLFPGYIFVKLAFPHEYDDVRWARGVSGIVRFGESPPPVVNDGVIEVFLDRMDGDGIIDTSRDLVPGKKVRFLSEPLRGMVGTILRNSSAPGRVHVLMDLLYQATIEVDDFQVHSL